MDRVVFRCKCGQRLSAPTSAAGKKARCPKCDEVVQLPQLIEERSNILPDWLSRPHLWLGGFSSLILFLLIGAYCLSVWADATPREEASEKISAATNLIDQQRYDAALSKLAEASALLDEAGIHSGRTVDRIEQLRSRPPLKHVLAGKVRYEGQWMTQHERKMRQQGYVQYGGEWITPEEKQKRERGYVKYGGTWVTPDEKNMLKKGFVKHEGRWVTPEEKAKLQAGYVKYEGRWVTPDEKSHLKRGLVKFEGGWTTPRGKATLICMREMVNQARNSSIVGSESPAQVVEELEAKLRFYDDLQLNKADPDLIAYANDYRSFVVDLYWFFKEFADDIEAADARIERAEVGGAIRGGLEAGRRARSPEEGFVGGAVLGFLGALHEGEQAKRREVIRLRRKWQGKLEEKLPKFERRAEELNNRRKRLFTELRSKYQITSSGDASSKDARPLSGTGLMNQLSKSEHQEGGNRESGASTGYGKRYGGGRGGYRP